MKEHSSQLPTACVTALAQIMADPLDLPEATELHVLQCQGCAEARVVWLAQAEAPPALAPAGYFEALPGRVLAKLPPPSRRSARHAFFWAAAAAFLLLVGTGGFFLGQRGRTPVTEATLTPPAQENDEILPDTPFQDGEEDATLTPEELQKVLKPSPTRNSQP